MEANKRGRGKRDLMTQAVWEQCIKKDRAAARVRSRRQNLKIGKWIILLSSFLLYLEQIPNWSSFKD